MIDFPLIHRLGLTVYDSAKWTQKPFAVFASDLERLLENAPIVHTENDQRFGWQAIEKDDGEFFNMATHTAMLVGMKPKQPPDTFESLVREIVDRSKTSTAENPKFKLNDWLKRARALVDSGEQ